MNFRKLQAFFGPRKSSQQSSLDPALIELVCVENAICDNYHIHRNDLVKMFNSISSSSELAKKHIKSVKCVRVEYDIPPELQRFGVNDKFVLSTVRSHAAEPSAEYSEHSTYNLLTEKRLRIENYDVQFWEWWGTRHEYPTSTQLIFVRKSDLSKYRRAILLMKKVSKTKIEEPILAKRMLTEIYDNSVGFIENYRSNREKYKKYNIPYKRGLLLCGQPGSGKTSTCKWLKALCEHKNIKYRIVAMHDYLKSAAKGRTRELFASNSREPVIVFFDDLDLIAKDRKVSPSTDLLVFLTELDGISPKEGAVYIFTTNQLEELDSAFVRPGRIDLFLTFRHPKPELRERFIKERFTDDILKFVDIADIVNRTDEYSFAEIEEIRKLLTFQFIAKNEINVEKVFEQFAAHRKEFKERMMMGFGKLEEEAAKDDYYDPDYD